MFNDDHRTELRRDLKARITQDSKVLDELRTDVRQLKGKVTAIQRRSAHSVSVVATDGGNNKFQFDPYMLQVVRVVDSNNNAYSLDVISPTMAPSELLAKHIDAEGKPLSALGRMMVRLKVKTLHELSSMIPEKVDPENPSIGWVSGYRELQEWAVLMDLAETKWGNDTILIFDGLLRTKKFNGALFKDYRQHLEGALEAHKKKNGRNVYVVGFSKDNQVLTRYRLALKLECIFDISPAYVEIPRELELKSYKWKEWARGDDITREGAEVNKFVGGKLFFVKFGKGQHDLIWPVDIIQPQIAQHAIIMGCLLNDTVNGFPIPHYPRSLQMAYENAAIVDFDLELLKHEVFEGIRNSLGKEGPQLDGLRLQDESPGSQR